MINKQNGSWNFHVYGNKKMSYTENVEGRKAMCILVITYNKNYDNN